MSRSSGRQRRLSMPSRVALAVRGSRSAQLELTAKAVEAGSEFINALDDDGFAPLHRACAAPNSENMVLSLIDAGADVNLQDLCGDTPLHWSVFCSNEAVARILLERGADQDVVNSSGKTPYHLAKGEGESSLLALLQREEKLPPAPSSELPTPPPQAPPSPSAPVRRLSLATAASQGDASLVEAALVGHEEEINGLDADGFTPLHRASALPNSEVVVVTLLKAGADVHLTDAFGDTALHWASFCGHPASVTVLLEHGADASIKNHDGKTPLDAAMEEEQTAVVKILQEAQKSATKAIEKPSITRQTLRESLKVKTKQGLLKKTRWPMRMCVLDWKRSELVIFPAGSGGKNVCVDFRKFLYVRQNSTKNIGVRFELAILTGETYSFLGTDQAQAKKWIDSLIAAGGKNMAACLVQRQIRRYLCAKKYKKMRKDRGFAIKLLSTNAHMSLSDMVAKDMEGPLSKKDDKGHRGRVVRLFRSRYFVLSHSKGVLTYYDNKTKRNLNYKPRKIAIKDFIMVRGTAQKNHCLFIVSLISGRTYEFLAGNAQLAKEWVQTLQATLPRENLAAYKIQARWRGLLARKKFRAVLNAHRERVKTAEAARKAEEAARIKAMTEAQQKEEEAVKRAKDAAVKRAAKFTRLRKLQEEAKIKKDQKAEAAANKRHNMAEKMKRLRELKASQAKKKAAVDNTVAKEKDVLPDTPENPRSVEIWVHANDEVSGKDYCFNEKTMETVWEVPAGDGPWVWLAKKDESSGQVYYINLATSETSWTHPAPSRDDSIDPESVPEQWRMVVDPSSGREYFVNMKTQKTSWERPECLMMGWVAVNGEDGRVYYFNPATNETSWTLPPLPDFVTGVSEEPHPVDVPAEATFAGKPFDEDEKVGFGSILEEFEEKLELQSELSYDTWLEKCTSDPYFLASTLNAFFPDALDSRALNSAETSDEGLPLESIEENLQLVVGAGKSIGATFNADMDISGCAMKDPFSCIELVWPLIQAIYGQPISIQKCPVLILLKGNDDEEEDETARFMKSSTLQAILIRWINHLAAAGGLEKRAANLGADLRDGEILLNVLRQTGDVVEEETVITSIISTLRQRNIALWMKPRYIEGGKARLLEALCAVMFTNNSGLRESDMSKEAVEKAQMLEEEDPTQTQEYRTYKMWLNSLVPYIEGAPVIVDLVEDLRDGVFLCKVLAVIAGDLLDVDFKRVNMKPRNRYHRVENTNYAISLCQELGFNLHNLGGLDILDCKDPKLLYALLYKCLQFHSLQIVSRALGLNQSGISTRDIDESEIIDWANEKCEDNGASGDLESFKSADLANSVFFMDLLEAMEPGVVDWDILKGVESKEDRKHNAQYVISVARKLGCPVFITWEDIIQVNRHMLMTFVANLMTMDLSKNSNSTLDQQVLTKERMRIK